MKAVQHARVHFNEQGTPVAEQFDDVYFSNDGGLAETDYVFLQHNGLPDRWQQHPAAFFHIAETGFGTGSNFLLTWLRFRQFRQQTPKASCQRLYFTSFEKFPLNLADLSHALAALPELTVLAQALLAQYPAPTPGCHRLVFDEGTVVLDLWLGDVLENLPQRDARVAVDAWFLDGFAPSKNPDMWQEALFVELTRHSTTGTTVATFTAAGIVKRGLLAAGFEVQKVKGFGRKRDMLTARFAGQASETQAQPTQAKDTAAAAEFSIVGGGIAAICLTLALLQKGARVQLFCADAQLGLGASKNRQGALYPNLHAEMTLPSLIQASCFGFSRAFFTRWQSCLDFPLDWCGVLHQACTSQLQNRLQKLAQHWPAALVQPLDADSASRCAGLSLPFDAIWYPNAGWLSPQQFCQTAAAWLTEQPGCRIHYHWPVERLEKNATGWLLHSSKHPTQQVDQLIIAAGAQSNALLPEAPLPLRGIRGQVSYVESASLSALKTVLCHKGYITPAWQGLQALGATFDRSRSTDEWLAADDAANLELAQQSLEQPGWLQGLSVVESRAGVRATVPDHFPLSGQWHKADQKLQVLTGLGARGLLFAPLLAEAMAADLLKEPSPLPKNWQQALHASRYQS
ncbi:bifunctional tRNA (5-methylaminomethyl-2-thiouridine)(34)-methyltransferase MnmD/FAD-dependent 5-carboxymethylaminomethyl-2-thiouridine(34) oxidoreductase MnmC [Alkalimonas delamerensis]|uniref:tRNA 5-methylaminomethyl-2-thiouridine biosynthesis bifunctional protein MnmC n=1 Tax=Alkalimonas delamerensis TaxID=265981 RepID=A0ABT9GSI9_9GAMM|nr:bifunctional tRNA (5-methylaminomethyl-2-thiouridine)(34)-methyltransferase MnmD/FAD-dependent 5-carboxymethylaminomethyl-2-thiouridine(34) oxidoreductase MnmC [Alkalimonas delamerensis]MDP4529937.1 bifunctional tRNA (5-methylaminomethyl-2-thiouridine)(34)-methyltransferase MnmD/FAD-dependent 5-carboxymethylaminomethyl-2-thiouridine(34) oxidoreductase MnmC [Alkalimonas delamerensis]